ncbi:hypothetical protein [Pleurocapsa sp. FMAR1]|uniref:hypothetical protein n=1 Tax=Pleurocapsa sp. FMAR1 TaxID=3040204 RepID=UPI0029C63CA4|nr:hypothetical protein [Pleurocapsa sp. FMAR1]
MKNIVFKSLIAACITSMAILSTAKASMAQVDMSFLTEVAESCQKDVFSSEYYQQMGIKEVVSPTSKDSDYYVDNCIKSRYFYLLVISKLPWLVSTNEMLPGYLGSVAISRIAYENGFSQSNMLDCLASKNKDSQECINSSFDEDTFYKMYSKDTPGKFDSIFGSQGDIQPILRLAYTCPSCVIAYNNNPSRKQMIGAFIEWFTKLKPSQKKELMSILGDEKAQLANRTSMRGEADKAWNEYTALRQRLAEEEKEQRRRELLGE